ncbi:inward rectifier potassium channel Kirbac3.1 [Kordia sp. SMS9]|uniref:ion channel n=1 Tax=Kordia sp. SMS9 TaxID=2282170 RepID=UPI000E0E0868|nr:ion channel [Kordia sp. SMS9]AXG70966.1 inward rectifier potassium channel Kirbac3.1 [Kordia sp. SMS9]
MAKKVKDPGLGEQSITSARRIVNKDGSFNIKHLNGKTGISALYAYLVDISWARFFLLVFLVYFVINMAFAMVYVTIGVEYISVAPKNFFADFVNAFFFSSQTITTLGYGAMAPTSILAGIVSSFQAVAGLLSFSFVTGLLYGRFSKPKASIQFSENIIYRDFKEGKALMFRLMNSKKDVMINPRVKVTLAITEDDEKQGYRRNFYQLALERDHITYLPTTWTLVHEIDKDSPLYKFSSSELKKLNGEFLIMVSYYDEAFNEEVYKLHSYTFEELLMNVAFEKSFYFDEEGYTVLDHHRISRTEKM